MAYIDAFLLPMPIASKEKYLEKSKAWTDICKAAGATRIVDYLGDDVPEGKLTSFPMAVKLEPGETIVLSWIEWPDKATRDAGNAKMREDPAMMSVEMPFDAKRMIFGGFEKINES